MQKFESARVQHSLSRWMDFEPAFVWDADETTHPLHGDIRGDVTGHVVVSNGKGRHGLALASQVTTGRPL